MTVKRTLVISFAAVWLSLDLAAEVARLIACQANPSPQLVAICSEPIGPGGGVLEHLRRLNDVLTPPSVETSPPVPPPVAVPKGGTKMDQLRREPTL